uniref:M48 family metallopeptidase n=1 Tax=Altererythrobacter segetis TaxID=1104773 RepID=UPI001409304B|nr:M48 family metallopeptidase [Altererythrobacter segetis]
MNVSLCHDTPRPVARPAACLKWLAILALAAAAPALATDDSLAPLRSQDERLLKIAEPILARNVALCDRTMPGLGVALQSADQYSAQARPPFAAPVAFAAVLPGSAAAQAGIERDDGLLSVDGQAIAKQPDLLASPLRDSAFALLSAHSPGKPLVLGIAHAGQAREVTIPAQQECLALVEILADQGNDARSDGRVIQIGFGLASRASDEQIATIFAHELAHSILHHRDRLSAADVNKGLLGEFGRNRRLNLQAEKEADRLSVHLLANSGYDPRAAAAFWRSKLGKQLSGGVFHDRMHLSAKARATMLDSEVSKLASGSASYPDDLMALRNQPMR